MAFPILLSSVALAQGTRIRAEKVAHVDAPIAMASAPGDFGRLFIVSQLGRIDILDLNTGLVLPTPFQPTIPVGDVNRPTGNGMLGMAFHPQFSSNGIFYLTMSTSSGIRLVQGHVSPQTPNVADAVLTPILVHSPGSGQHTGGWIGFGLDGYLYLPLGDGHMSSRAQDPMVLFGKIIRIDVDGADNVPGNADDDAFPEDANRNYSIPPTNPYADGVAARAEIWARGVRNPYRGSIDPVTGDLWWGEVGDSWEEINRLPAGAAGRNMGHGWTQGPVCTSTPANCATPGLMNALFAYRTGSAAPFGGNSIMGGVVYRGCAMPQLYGTFVFADYFRTWFGGLRVENDQLVLTTESIGGMSLAASGITCFGTDARGEIYFARLYGDEVYRLEPAVDRDCNSNGVNDACESLSVCVADFNGDCGVTIDDLLGFLTAFEAGDVGADMGNEAGGPTLDAAVTITDLLNFLTRFEAGC